MFVFIPALEPTRPRQQQQSGSRQDLIYNKDEALQYYQNYVKVTEHFQGSSHSIGQLSYPMSDCVGVNGIWKSALSAVRGT